MKSSHLRLALAIACAAIITLIPATAQNQQGQTKQAIATQATAATAKGLTAGEYFKNVTTPTLKGLTPSDFLGAMGVMTAAVGYDCSNCHPGAGTDKFDFVSDQLQVKRTARRMVEMVTAINKTHFGGAQMVTCWTCHHQQDVPTTSIQLDRLYSDPVDEKRDILRPGEGVPPAMTVLDQYIQALGGAQKLSAVEGYIATGKAQGYEGLGGDGLFQIFAQAPDKRGVWITFPDHPDRGTSAWTYDGKTGWISQPRGLLGQWELTGSDLAGAKLDAVMSFPGRIKNAFPTWRAGPDDNVAGKEVWVLQGSGPGGILGTFYFDKKTHYLVRYVRQTPSPVGRISIQQDFDDYRDVNGVKFPFKYSFLWLDGRFTATMTDVKVNVSVPAAKVGKP
jgi:hypothetical protein